MPARRRGPDEGLDYTPVAADVPVGEAFLPADTCSDSDGGDFKQIHDVKAARERRLRLCGLGALLLLSVALIFSLVLSYLSGGRINPVFQDSQMIEPKYLSAHDVATVLDEYSQFQRPRDELDLQLLQERTEQVAPDLSAEDVARTLSALAALHLTPSRPLLTALALRARQVANKMTAQDVTRTINAYADLRQL